LFVTALTLAGCGPGPAQAVPASAVAVTEPHAPSTPTPANPPTVVPQPSAASQITGYEFPAAIDPGSRYLFYLHGKIIEDQGLPAISPDYGEYEYASILKALEDHGFVVISEQRPKDTDGVAYAERVRGQVALLLAARVPSGNITVVGASKGASIAANVSYLLEDPEVNYVLLGSCPPSMIDEWKSNGMWLHGNVLAIYDYADVEYSGSCEELFRMSEGRGLGRHQEIVLHVGTGHGILYKPLDEWILPTVEWASG
jgi:hypothetical protein